MKNKLLKILTLAFSLATISAFAVACGSGNGSGNGYPNGAGPVSASEYDKTATKGLKYSFLPYDNGIGVQLDGIGSVLDKDIRIPSQVNGYPVIAVASSAFSGFEEINSLVIPDTVTYIGNSAFSTCPNLKSVVIGSGVIKIGEEAFYSCENLSSVVVGKSVKDIEPYAFSSCRSLVEVVNKSPNLTITKEDSEDNGYLGNYALDIYNHTDKFTATKISYVDDYTIYTDGADKMLIGYTGKEEKLTLPTGITAIHDRAFYKCDEITKVVIPDGVTSIGDYAFEECKNLTSAVIPNCVTSIGDYAFSYCDNLKYNVKDNLRYLGSDANPYLYLMKNSLTSITSATIDSGCRFIACYAFSSCKSLSEIVIPNGITSIGDCAFYYCENLTRIEIPASVTKIGAEILNLCTKLTNIEVNSNNNHYQSIDGNLYSKDGKALMQYAIGKTATSFTIPNGVTSIGDHAFYECDNLTSVVIPAGVSKVGDYAFAYCRKLSIYCEANKQPDDWQNSWNYSNCPVTWGYKGEN